MAFLWRLGLISRINEVESSRFVGPNPLTNLMPNLCK